MHLLDSLKSRLQKRSYWVLKYVDGHSIREGEMDWSDCPFPGRQALTLYCPNGDAAELGSTNATGRLFQLKVAVITMGMGRVTLAHIIGHVESADGSCRYAAWNYETQRLEVGHDNVNDMQYQKIGKISFDPMGLRF